MAASTRSLFLLSLLVILGAWAPAAAEPTAQPADLALLTRVAARDTAGATAPPIYRYTLANGLRIWCQPRYDSRSVTAALVLAAGGRYETPADAGISHFVEHMLFTGTARRSEDEILNAITRRGGRWNGMTEQETTTYYAQVASDDFDLALDWLVDVVFNATLPADKVERERKIIFQERWGRNGWLLNRLERWGFGYDLERSVLSRLFPGSALAQSVIGEDESLDGLAHADLLRYYAERYVPANAVLVVAGNVTPQHVFDQATLVLARLPAAPRPAGPPPAAPGSAGPYDVTVRGPWLTDQVRLMLGAATVGATHPDRWPLEVLGAVLSKDLQEEARQRQGWVYGIRAANNTYTDAGYFAISTDSAPEHAGAIIRMADEQIERVRRGELPSERVEEAKSMLLGRWALSMESNEAVVWWLSDWATVLAGDQPLPDYAVAIAAVTPDDVARVVQTYFTPANRYVALHRPVLTVPGIGRIAITLVVLGVAGVAGWRWRRRPQRVKV